MLPRAEAFLFFKFLTCRLARGSVESEDAVAMIKEILARLQLPPQFAVDFFADKHHELAAAVGLKGGNPQVEKGPKSRGPGTEDPCPYDATHRRVADVTRVIVDENNLGVFYDQLSNSRCIA